MITPFTYAMTAAEFFLGLAVMFGAGLTLKNIFAYKIKSFTVVCLISALIFPASIWLKYLISSDFTLNIAIPVGICVIPIWLFLTDKSIKSLAASFAAIVFSSSVSLTLAKLMSDVGERLFYSATSPHSYIAVHFVCNIIAIGIIILIGIIGKNRTEQKLSLRNIFILAALAYIAMQFISDSENKSAEIFAAVALLWVVAAVVLSVKISEAEYYRHISEVTESYLNSRKKFYDSCRESAKEIRRIKHDMKNHLLCIGELSSNGSLEELKEYVTELTQKLNDADKSIHTGNEIADAIVNEKYEQANRSGITLVCEGCLNEVQIKPIDICTILSNLLENALEAAEKAPTEDKIVSLSFRKNRNFLLVTVTNPTSVMVKISDNSIFTVKSDNINHGFGLANIRLAIAKYGGELNLICKEKGNAFEFTSEVILPLKSYEEV